MLEEAEAIAQKIPNIVPDEKPKEKNPHLVTSSETPSSASKIQKIKKEVHNMTEKRLAALAKAREARQAKRRKKEEHMKVMAVEQDERFQKLTQTIVQMQQKLDALQDIPRESNANLPANPGPGILPDPGRTLSPIRRSGFANLEHSNSLKF